MRNKHKRKYYLIWVPAVLVLLAILGFTLQKGGDSVALSNSVLAWLVQLAQSLGNSPETLTSAWWNDWKMIRRLAHTAEYFLLGGAVQTAVKRAGPAGLICAGASLLDETVKAVTPGKEFDFRDIPFDIAGYAAGIAAAALVQALRGKTNTAKTNTAKTNTAKTNTAKTNTAKN